MNTQSKRICFSIGIAIFAIATIYITPFWIYGPSRMYYPQPPENEAWTRISSFKEPSRILLADGSIIGISPFCLTERGKALSTDQVVEAAFGTPSKELYLRENRDGVWMVRMKIFFACSLPHWFPKRIYGFYEEELIECLYHGPLIRNSEESRVVDFPNEETELEYVHNRRQNQAVDTTVVSDPR